MDHSHAELLQAITAVNTRLDGVDDRLAGIERRLANEIPHQERNTRLLALVPTVGLVSVVLREVLRWAGLPIP